MKFKEEQILFSKILNHIEPSAKYKTKNDSYEMINQLPSQISSKRCTTKPYLQQSYKTCKT